MLLQLVNVLYVLVAISMIALILMQRGAGAQAGSGFGGGASSTVFGSRGASNFLTKSTKWLAILFFIISLGMAYYATHSARLNNAPTQADLGVMGQAAAPAVAPQAPSAQVPTAPAQQPASPVTVPKFAQPVPVASPAATTPEPAPAQGQ